MSRSSTSRRSAIHQSNIPASNFVVYSIFLNVEVILYNIIQHFILVLLLLSQHKGYNVIKWVKIM